MPELILSLKGRELRRQPLLKTQTTVGRHVDNDVVIDNVGISRAHALIRYENGRFVVLDYGSSNGLYVNGKPCKSHELADGDEIMVGKFAVVFSAQNGVPPERLEHVERPKLSPDSSSRLGSEVTRHLNAVDIAKLINPASDVGAPAGIAPARGSVRPAPARPAGGSRTTALVVALALALALAGVLAYMLFMRH